MSVSDIKAHSTFSATRMTNGGFFKRLPIVRQFLALRGAMALADEVKAQQAQAPGATEADSR